MAKPNKKKVTNKLNELGSAQDIFHYGKEGPYSITGEDPTDRVAGYLGNALDKAIAFGKIPKKGSTHGYPPPEFLTRIKNIKNPQKRAATYAKWAKAAQKIPNMIDVMDAGGYNVMDAVKGVSDMKKYVNVESVKKIKKLVEHYGKLNEAPATDALKLGLDKGIDYMSQFEKPEYKWNPDLTYQSPVHVYGGTSDHAGKVGQEFDQYGGMTPPQIGDYVVSDTTKYSGDDYDITHRILDPDNKRIKTLKKSKRGDKETIVPTDKATLSYADYGYGPGKGEDGKPFNPYETPGYEVGRDYYKKLDKYGGVGHLTDKISTKIGPGAIDDLAKGAIPWLQQYGPKYMEKLGGSKDDIQSLNRKLQPQGAVGQYYIDKYKGMLDHKISNKRKINESTWKNRQFGEPLPTMADYKKAHNERKVQEQGMNQYRDGRKLKPIEKPHQGSSIRANKPIGYVANPIDRDNDETRGRVSTKYRGGWQKNENNLNEVDYSKVVVPAQVKRWMGKFIGAVKDANLNKMKRIAILFAVVKALGISGQEFQQYFQRVKREI